MDLIAGFWFVGADSEAPGFGQVLWILIQQTLMFS
jgi:hypothetical protein